MTSIELGEVDAPLPFLFDQLKPQLQALQAFDQGRKWRKGVTDIFEAGDRRIAEVSLQSGEQQQRILVPVSQRDFAFLFAEQDWSLGRKFLSRGGRPDPLVVLAADVNQIRQVDQADLPADRLDPLLPILVEEGIAGDRVEPFVVAQAVAAEGFELRMPAPTSTAPSRL